MGVRALEFLEANFVFLHAVIEEFEIFFGSGQAFVADKFADID